MLARFAARIQAAMRAKEQAIQRHHEEIRYYIDLLAQLETDVTNDQKRAVGPEPNQDQHFN